MSDLKSRWKSVSDKKKWAARGGSFVVKVKATKAVWFPPEPVGTGKKAASTTDKATKKAAKKATTKTTSAAKKTSSGAKNATKPLRRKQKA